MNHTCPAGVVIRAPPTPAYARMLTNDAARENISIGIQYLGAWLAGSRAVLIRNPMEDAARLFERITLGEDFVEFLTLPAYDEID